MTDDLVTLKKYEEISGRTVKSMQRKIEDGKIVEGIHYFRDPDGGIMVSREGMRQWATGARAKATDSNDG